MHDSETSFRATRIAIPAAFLLVSLAPAQSWPQFRGPFAKGLAVGDAPLPIAFGPRENLVWRTATPRGHSSPCIHGTRLFLTGVKNNTLLTLCIDRKTGAERWRKSVEVERLARAHRVNSAASPTPATDGERVYVYFGSYGLLAYDYAGELVWRRRLAPDRNTFGTATSPILHGDWLILNRDTSGPSFLLAVDKATGENRLAARPNRFSFRVVHTGRVEARRRHRIARLRRLSTHRLRLARRARALVGARARRRTLHHSCDRGRARVRHVVQHADQSRGDRTAEVRDGRAIRRTWPLRGHSGAHTA